MSVSISTSNSKYQTLQDKDKKKIKDAIDAYLQGTSLGKGQQVNDKIKLSDGYHMVNWKVTAVDGKSYSVLITDLV